MEKASSFHQTIVASLTLLWDLIMVISRPVPTALETVVGSSSRTPHSREIGSGGDIFGSVTA